MTTQPGLPGTSADLIDPEVANGLQQYFATVGKGGLMAIPELAERRAKLAALMAGGEDGASADPGQSDLEVTDHDCPTTDGAVIRVRSYRPRGSEGRLPAMLYMHGGGMILGDLDSDDGLARAITTETGCLTVSVEYRLAPEHPFPQPVEDCYAALVWLEQSAELLGADPERLAVYGGSAGGGLAAAVALVARDRGGPMLALQVLLYPMLDDRCETPSSYEVTDIGVWDRSANLEAWDLYLGRGRGSDQPSRYAAPARAATLAGLPPAFIEVGQLDLFRDETISYASRLMEARVPTELHVYPGAVHSSEVLAPTADVSRRILANRWGALRRFTH